MELTTVGRKALLQLRPKGEKRSRCFPNGFSIFSLLFTFYSSHDPPQSEQRLQGMETRNDSIANEVWRRPRPFFPCQVGTLTQILLFSRYKIRNRISTVNLWDFLGAQINSFHRTKNAVTGSEQSTVKNVNGKKIVSILEYLIDVVSHLLYFRLST